MLLNMYPEPACERDMTFNALPNMLAHALAGLHAHCAANRLHNNARPYTMASGLSETQAADAPGFR